MARRAEGLKPRRAAAPAKLRTVNGDGKAEGKAEGKGDGAAAEPKMTVRAVERALLILSIVARSMRPIGLSEISRAADLDKATVLRLLTTLEVDGFVSRNQDGRSYTLGARFIQLLGAWHVDIRRMARLHMERLSRVTGETVGLIEARGTEAVRVEGIASSHELGMSASVGRSAPMYAGAGGKSIMAHLPKAEIDRIVEVTELRPVTPDTITVRETLMEELEQVRRQGFAHSIGENVVGAASVAAPVFNAGGYPVAAITVSGPQIRLKRARLLQIAPLVREAAMALSQELGYSPPAPGSS